MKEGTPLGLKGRKDGNLGLGSRKEKFVGCLCNKILNPTQWLQPLMLKKEKRKKKEGVTTLGSIQYLHN